MSLLSCMSICWLPAVTKFTIYVVGYIFGQLWQLFHKTLSSPFFRWQYHPFFILLTILYMFLHFLFPLGQLPLFNTFITEIHCSDTENLENTGKKEAPSHRQETRWKMLGFETSPTGQKPGDTKATESRFQIDHTHKHDQAQQAPSTNY